MINNFIDTLFIVLIFLLIVIIAFAIILYSGKKGNVLYFDKLKYADIDKNEFKEKKRRKSIFYAIVKRLNDVIIGIFGSIITILIAIVVAPLTFFEDGGPIFIKRKFIGYGRKEQTCYTFRTIKKEYNEQTKYLKIGRFLYKSSLEYMPMYISVLTGKMTLVGVCRRRPEDNITEEEKDFYLYEKPGFVNMYAVFSQKLKDNSKKIKMYSDKYYLNNQSIMLDVQVLLWCVRTSVRKDI